MMLEADRARLADIEAEILRFERSLSALRAEQALLQERLSSCTYPVLNLPNEIVSEIFIHVLPIYPLCPPLSGNDSPMSLTQICRQWRAVAVVTRSSGAPYSYPISAFHFNDNTIYSIFGCADHAHALFPSVSTMGPRLGLNYFRFSLRTAHAGNT
ncbi:hypothetical protein B0H19DRAFT_144576 [Mycena capillaripes]|nr:hypothetical protein B0H19DRAFT_144576 [Mycena capillaripes]